MRFTIGLRWKAVKSLAVSNPSLPFEDWGFLLTMKKRTNFFRLETFLVASLGVHLLLFLTLSIFSGDAAKSLISPPRLEVHLLSIASPAIAEERLSPKSVFPSLQRKVQPPPLKIQHPESAPIEKLDTRFQTAPSDASREENKRIPSVREEGKSPEESPAKEATVEWTDSGPLKDDESLWIQTSRSFEGIIFICAGHFSSARSPNVFLGWRNARREDSGGQRGVSIRRRNLLRSSQIFEQPQTGLSSRSQAEGASGRSHPKSGSPRERPGGSDRDQKVFRT